MCFAFQWTVSCFEDNYLTWKGKHSLILDSSPETVPLLSPWKPHAIKICFYISTINILSFNYNIMKMIEICLQIASKNYVFIRWWGDLWILGGFFFFTLVLLSFLFLFFHLIVLQALGVIFLVLARIELIFFLTAGTVCSLDLTWE